MALSKDIMKVLVACEFSGIVRDAFILRGHNAISCDFLESEKPGPHIVGSVLDLLSQNWDLMIAFPPCTYVCGSGIHWNKRIEGRELLTGLALEFVASLMNCAIPKICIENPIGVISTRIRKPDQIIQPWWFGHDASKSTCLWLKNLPKLTPTEMVVRDRYSNQTPSGQNNLGPSATRWKERSRTYAGIAAAMASQWG